MSLRVLVVDDTALFRTVVADALRLIEGVEVIGTANNGQKALAGIPELKPDIITLDMEMPGMDGLQVLEEIRKAGFDIGVIVISSFTVRGGGLTIRALEKGAFDFITKPTEGTMEENRKTLLEALAPRIRAFGGRRKITNLLQKGPVAPAPVPAPVHAVQDLTAIAARMERVARPQRIEVVLIGVSTGGPVALGVLLPAINPDINVPIVIVQHMPPLFTAVLAESLDEKCSISVKEGVSGEILKPNVAYIAPGGKQMKLCSTPEGQKSIVVTDDPPENNCKPSVDYLFRSAALAFPGRCMAVLLTGMGSDGTLGLRLLKRNHCFSIAQDEASCVVYGMPKAAADAGVVDEVLPLDRIAFRIRDIVPKGIP